MLAAGGSIPSGLVKCCRSTPLNIKHDDCSVMRMIAAVSVSGFSTIIIKASGFSMNVEAT
jgi:hypothetical protein